MNALIGNTGLIGKYLKTCYTFSHEYNSSNIDKICQNKFDRVYIAAPTGNRLTANAAPEKDFLNIKYLFDNLKKTSIQKVILIGTVDSVLRNTLPYGANRLWLETQIKNTFQSTHVIRLSSLIHQNITKNVLYDLKHNIYLDKINLNAEIQWYDLNNLKQDIDYMIQHNQQECNLVSVPIANKEIVDCFFPKLHIESYPIINHTLSPYTSTKEDIFQSMKEYING